MPCPTTRTAVLSALFACIALASRQCASSAELGDGGPSFSCTVAKSSADPAESAIERAICADPKLSKLDRSLDQAFRQALSGSPTGKTKLLAEQRVWLKSRVPACQIEGTSIATAAIETCLAELYDVRIAALQGSGAPNGAMVCRALATRIRETKGYLTEAQSLGTALRDDGRSPVIVGKGQPLTQALLDTLPSKPELDLKNEDATLYHFGADRSLFAISSVQGTAHCENIWLYRIVKGGAFEKIGDPEQKGDGDGCGATTLFGSYADPTRAGAAVPLYIDTADSIPRSSLTFFTRSDDAWHHACRLYADYDAALAIDERYCAPGAPCAALANLALELARERDVVGGTDTPSRLGDALRVTADEEKDQVELPTFGKTGNAFDMFEAEAPVYQVAGPSGPLALRISHGTVGWRIDENWLVGIYKPGGKALEPLAGFAIKKFRTKLREVTVR